MAIAFSSEGTVATRGRSPARARPRRHRRRRQQASARKAAREPIVVGGTLSLTGSFAATGVIHKAAGPEAFVRWINSNDGLRGRPVEWKLYDDESDQPRSPPSTSG